MLSILDEINEKKIVLASSSPRRKEILGDLAGVKFEIIPSRFEENLSVELKPVDFAVLTARKKAEEVDERLSKDGKDCDLIISADTIVVLEGEILGKPHNPENSMKMLKKLSGKEHSVFTGVSLLLPKKKTCVDFHVETKVFFDELTEVVIQKYIDTKEPFDKAGGYGIQGIGGCLISKIEGDYFNVVGFPLNRFCNEMYKLKMKDMISNL